MTISIEVIIIGALTGLTYAILASGLVLIYRATRVINFAHGEIGAFGAALLAKLVLDYHWNFYLAFLAMLAVGGAIGAAIELTVIRRLFKAPRLILLVATIGVAQILFFAQAVLPGVKRVARYPTGIHRSVKVGSLLLNGEHFMVLVFVPLVLAGLAFFLNRTRYGVAIRAAAENADAARLAGISVRRVSTTVWLMGGALATATAVLIAPIRGTLVGLPTPALGPGLLMRALACALLGRMSSLSLTLVGGLVLGVVEAELLVNVKQPGVADFIIFIAVVVLVFWRGRQVTKDDEGGTWSLTPKVKAIPERLLAVDWVRRLPQLGAGLALAAAVLPLAFSGASQVFLFTRVLLFAVIALSVTVLTGWAGQLSLGQFAFVGLGAMTTVALHNRGMPFAIAVFYATVAGVIAALCVGGPALRIRGLFLAITTLAFAVAARSYILPHRLFTDGKPVQFLPRGKWWFLDLHDHRTYYFVCLLILVAAVFAVTRLRNSGVGRSIIAVRENDQSASSFSVSPARAKLIAFGVAGGAAALAGALLAGAQVQVGVQAFGPGGVAPGGGHDDHRRPRLGHRLRARRRLRDRPPGPDPGLAIGAAAHLGHRPAAPAHVRARRPGAAALQRPRPPAAPGRPPPGPPRRRGSPAHPPDDFRSGTPIGSPLARIGVPEQTRSSPRAHPCCGPRGSPCTSAASPPCRA